MNANLPKKILHFVYLGEQTTRAQSHNVPLASPFVKFLDQDRVTTLGCINDEVCCCKVPSSLLLSCVELFVTLSAVNVCVVLCIIVGRSVVRAANKMAERKNTKLIPKLHQIQPGYNDGEQNGIGKTGKTGKNQNDR